MPLTRDGLFCPQSLLDAPKEVRRAVCNGCGSARAKFDFVPDHVYGLRIGPACDIHDWMYHLGKTLADKQEADRVFLNNILRLIERRRGRIGIRSWRRRLHLVPSVPFRP